MNKITKYFFIAIASLFFALCLASGLKFVNPNVNPMFLDFIILTITVIPLIAISILEYLNPVKEIYIVFDENNNIKEVLSSKPYFEKKSTPFKLS